MFWGLIMEPQRKYSQKVKKSFHVSMAALDIATCTDNEPTQVICSFDNRNYLLCTLQKDKVIQVPLDLNYEVDDIVCFATNGNANIHLTGYLTDEFGDLDDTADLNDTVDSDDTSDSVDVEEAEEKIVPRKRQSVENNSSPPKKKSKTLELLAAVDSHKEDTDSDDSDFDLSTALNEEGSDDEVHTTQEEEEEDEEGDKDEEDDKEDDDDAEEEESENEDEESDDDDDDEEASSLSDNEEVEKPKAAKVNGVPKKEEQKQKQAKKEVLESPVSQKEKKQKTQQQQQKGEKTPKNENKTPGKASKLLKDENKTPEQTAKSPAQSPALKRTLAGGVFIEDLKVGNGPAAKTGRVVQVYYEGRFKNNKKMFDSSTKGPGFKFRLGRQEVIKGWDVGVVGMKVGGKRRITCPPNMAYGQKGSPPAIPPNSTLVFEVELKNVN